MAVRGVHKYKIRNNPVISSTAVTPNKQVHQDSSIQDARWYVYALNSLLHQLYIYPRAGRGPRLNGLVSCACEAVTATTVTGNDSNYRQHTRSTSGKIHQENATYP